MKKVSTILIIIGILVALSPFAGRLYMYYNENRLLTEWYNSENAADAEAAAASEADPEEEFHQLQDAFRVDARNIRRPVAEDTAQTTSEQGIAANESGSAGEPASPAAGSPVSKPKQKPAEQQTVLGVIKIDKIKVKYPIVEGVKESNLKQAIGHIPGTAGLGQPGNCALAGHRNYTFGRYFNRLDELKVGDLISVSTKKEEFIYKVYEKLVVTPDDVSVIKGGKDDTILTLITCTPIYIATHRLIVHARLENKILLEP